MRHSLLHMLTLPLLLAGCGLTAYNISGDTGDTDAFPNGSDSGAEDDVSDTESADDDPPSDTETDDPTLEDIEIDDVDPNFGSNAGGNTVAILGGPFDASARVYFGGEEGTVVSANAGSLVVETPEYSDVGYVKVKVVTDTGSGQVSNAYQYWEDGDGLTGALGFVEWTNYVGDYWSDTPVDEGSAGFGFIEPTDVAYWELYASAKDTCSSEFESSITYSFYNPDAPSIDLVSTSASIELEDDGDGYFSPDDSDGDGYADINSTEYRAGTTYALDEVSGGSDWPSFAVPGMVSTPSSFQVSTPRLDSASVPTVRQNDFNIEWSGSGGDYMLAVLYRFNGSSVVEVVTCVMNDDGSFKVPSSVWSGWTTNQQMTTLVARAKESGATMEHDNSTSGVVGLYWVFGAAFTQ